MGQIQIKHGSNTKCIKANMGQIQIKIWVKFKSFGELSQAEIGLCARHQCSLECTLKCFSGCSEIEILHKYKQLGKSGRYLLENICSWPHLSASTYSILTTSTCNGPAIQGGAKLSTVCGKMDSDKGEHPKNNYGIIWDFSQMDPLPWYRLLVLNAHTASAPPTGFVQKQV